MTLADKKKKEIALSPEQFNEIIGAMKENIRQLSCALEGFLELDEKICLKFFEEHEAVFRKLVAEGRIRI